MKISSNIVCALALLAGGIGGRMSSQVDEDGANLQAQVAKEKEARALLEAKVDALYSWVDSLGQAGSILTKAMDDARTNGFEYAAPNLQARTDIIEGVKGFAAALLAKRPKVVEPKEEKKSTRNTRGAPKK